MRKAIWMLVLFAMCSAANAEMYRWVDQDGNVTYMDQPPPDEVREASMLKLPFLGGSSRVRLEPVVLYFVPGCTACDAAKEYMARKGVPYTEKNVEENVDMQRELRQRAGTLSVPTLIVGKTVMKGYTEGWLESQLRSAGYFQDGAKIVAKPKVSAAEAEDTALMPPPEK